MCFCTRGRMLGIVATMAFTATLVYPVHSGLGEGQSTTESKPSASNGESPSHDVADKDPRDSLDRFLRLIEEETTFDFFETPLEEVASEIAQRHDINVMLNKPALEDLAIDASEPITIEIGRVSLETALDMLLREHNLDYGFQENVLIISTVEDVETRLQTHVYNVRDMLNAKQPWRSLDLLMEAIAGSVGTDSWEEVGGPGTIHAYQGNLIVSQTWRQHREIARLLKVLRQNIQAAGGPKMALPPKAATDAQPGGMSGGGMSGGGMGGGGMGGGGGSAGGGGFFQVEEIQRTRDDETHDGEAEEKRDPFNTDAEAGADPEPFAGVDPFAEPERIVVDGSLLLTTEETAAAELTTRYYNARPLLNTRDPDASLSQLIELMTATVAPDSWVRVGGPGTAGQYEGVLIVSTTRFVHARVDAFLNDLGDALAAAGGVELAKPHTLDRPGGGRGRSTRR